MATALAQHGEISFSHNQFDNSEPSGRQILPLRISNLQRCWRRDFSLQRLCAIRSRVGCSSPIGLFAAAPVSSRPWHPPTAQRGRA